MAKRDDDQASGGSDTPLLIEGPKGTAPIIDLEPLDGAHASAAAEEPARSRWKLPLRAPLAAGIAIAVIAGVAAGAAGTASLMRDDGSASLASARENHALKESVAQLGSELATLKAGIASAQKSATSQFGKLADRLERAEKAQAEPSAKLAKIQESIDRLGRQQQVATVTPAPATMTAPAPTAAPEVTGSIAPKGSAAPKKEETRPPVAEGWRMRDFYAGRALVQSRSGTLFEVGPGSNLPGLGRVEQIKRENGQVVVIAQNGVISGTPMQRRPAYYPPYRY